MLRQELLYTTQQPCEQVQQNRLKPASALAVLNAKSQPLTRITSSLGSLILTPPLLSTDSESSLKETGRTLDTSGPRASDTMK